MQQLIFTRILLVVILLHASNCQNKNDPEIWNYFLSKYSKGNGRYLTSSEISTLIRQNQNPINSCQHQSVEPSVVPSISSKSTNCSLITHFESHVFDLNSTCPRILYAIDNHNCWSLFGTSNKDAANSEPSDDLKTPGNVVGTRNEDAPPKPSAGEVWGYGILLVTLISCSSLAGVSVMPFMGKKLYKNILTVLIGLAVGSLTGSSIFHLIPQAYGLLASTGSHNYLYTSLVICGGIWMFFMVERLLKIIMEHNQRNDDKWKQAKKASIYSNTPEASTISILAENRSDKAANGSQFHHKDSRNSSFCSPTSTGIIYECQEQAIKASFGHQEKPRCNGGHEKLVKFEQGKDSVIATVAWMIIFGDGLHNFIDGLSIGAAFNQSILTGVSISVAVLCEELPHELGDFAVLLNAGMSIRQALTYNFLSACTCYIGLAIGIFLGEVEASVYIFGLAGGMFLYISLVDMVPEMNEVAEESSKISVREGLKVLLLQNVGMLAGVTTLFILAMYQDNIQF